MCSAYLPRREERRGLPRETRPSMAPGLAGALAEGGRSRDLRYATAGPGGRGASGERTGQEHAETQKGTLSAVN